MDLCRERVDKLEETTFVLDAVAQCKLVSRCCTVGKLLTYRELTAVVVIMFLLLSQRITGFTVCAQGACISVQCSSVLLCATPSLFVFFRFIRCCQLPLPLCKHTEDVNVC